MRGRTGKGKEIICKGEDGQIKEGKAQVRVNKYGWESTCKRRGMTDSGRGRTGKGRTNKRREGPVGKQNNK